MTMPKYFYSDPLKAIWMLDKFDVKLITENSPAPILGIGGLFQWEKGGKNG